MLPFFKLRHGFARRSIEDPVVASAQELVREMSDSVEFVVWSCAIANAIERGVPLPMSTVIRHLPERPKLYPAVLHGLGSIYVDRDTLLAFSSYYAAADTAVEFATGPLDRQRLPDASRTAAWRCAASRAVAAVKQAQLFLANIGSDDRLPSEGAIVGLLEEVARGGILGIDQEGGVRPLRIVESRRFSRYPKRIPALIDVGGEHLSAVVRDISRGGCGIDVTRLLPRGLSVAIELDDRTRLCGAVVWSGPLHAGVEFTTPISEEQAMHMGQSRLQ